MAGHDIFRESHSVKRWRGSIDNVRALAESAVRQIAEVSSNETVNLRGSFHWEGGRESPFRGEADLVSRLDTLDLSSLEEFSVFAGDSDDGVQVYLTLRTSGGVQFSVYGTNEIAVAGIAKRLGETADRGKRQIGTFPWNDDGFLAIGLGAILGALIAYANEADTLAYVLFGVGVASFVCTVVLLAFMDRIAPPIELLTTDTAETRVDRIRKRAGQAALFVAGAVVYAVVNQLID